MLRPETGEALAFTSATVAPRPALQAQPWQVQARKRARQGAVGACGALPQLLGGPRCVDGGRVVSALLGLVERPAAHNRRSPTYRSSALRVKRRYGAKGRRASAPTSLKQQGASRKQPPACTAAAARHALLPSQHVVGDRRGGRWAGSSQPGTYRQDSLGKYRKVGPPRQAGENAMQA